MNASAVPPGGGLASNATALISGLFKLIGVRFSIAVMEFADARDAVLRVLLLGALAVLAAAFALLSLTAMIVALAWDALGWRILLILFLAYVLLALGMLWNARSIIASGQIGFPMTLAELQKDHAALLDAHDDPERKA